MIETDSLTKKRKQAGQLLDALLDECISAQVALNRWPETDEPGDSSLDIAYQALWHFEADEDKQQTELFYMDAQLELLRQIAGFLNRGEALPAYMLRIYAPEHHTRFFYPLSFWEDTLRRGRRLADRTISLWRTSLALGLPTAFRTSLHQTGKNPLHR